MKGDIFYAKIMLFGEYSVIFDSMGLTVPYTHFTGELSFINFEKYTNYENAVESNQRLSNYLPFLQQLQWENPLNLPIDLNRFKEDISEGLYFESNIPQGYGIGSSGALVAAIYDEYSDNRIRAKQIMTGPEIAALKNIFAGMESFFHGRSSGLDPLLCYIRHPLLIKSKNEIETVRIPGEKFGSNFAIFLLDTGITGQTGPLVSLFLEKCRDEKYLAAVREVMIPNVNGCISKMLDGEMDAFFANLEILSGFEFNHLSEMIPDNMKSLWSVGLERDDFKIKLCGSGGGGFLLGISKDFKRTRKYLHQLGVKHIPVYINE